MRVRMMVLAAALVVASPAAAKDVTVTFNEDEQKALWAVFDAAIKAEGMKLSGNAVYLWQKLQAAAEADKKPAAPPAEAK